MEITIPNPDQDLKVGMIAAVAVATGQAPTAVTVVPLTAVVRSKTNPEGYALFVVEETARPPDRPPAGQHRIG